MGKTKYLIIHGRLKIAKSETNMSSFRKNRKKQKLLGEAMAKHSWLDIIKYQELLDDLTEEEKELVEDYFEDLRIDGMANTYHFDDAEDIKVIRTWMKDDDKDPQKLERVLAVLEKALKDNKNGFDVILNY